MSNRWICECNVIIMIFDKYLIYTRKHHVKFQNFLISVSMRTKISKYLKKYLNNTKRIK